MRRIDRTKRTAQHLHKFKADRRREVHSKTYKSGRLHLWSRFPFHSTADGLGIAVNGIAEISIFHTAPVEQKLHALLRVIGHLFADSYFLFLLFLPHCHLSFLRSVLVAVMEFQFKSDIAVLTVQETDSVIFLADLAGDLHIEDQAAFVHMRPRVIRQVKPSVLIVLNIQRSVIDIVVINENVIAALGQLTQILINKPLNRRILCGNGKCLIDLQRTLAECMRFDIVTVKIYCSPPTISTAAL